MTTTTPLEGRCLYCGTTRPVREPVCASCGKPWTDRRLDDRQPSTTDEPIGSAESTEDGQTSAAGKILPPPFPMIEHDAPELVEAPEAASTRRWMIPAALAAVVAVVYVAVFFFILDRTDDAASPTTSPTTTSAVTSTVTTTAPTTTTVPATTTTPPESSTSTTTTTTTTTVPTIEPIGDPYPLDQLQLGAFALGPFDFGGSNPDVAGRLVATFGAPDRIEDGSPAWGLCPDQVGRAITWGPLTAIFRSADGADVLVGYRLEAPAGDDPAGTLKTLSGLGLGATVADLRSIYASSTVDFVEIDGRDHFRLRRSTDGVTLLWGPVDSREASGTIGGIYSPMPCDGGP